MSNSGSARQVRTFSHKVHSLAFVRENAANICLPNTILSGQEFKRRLRIESCIAVLFLVNRRALTVLKVFEDIPTLGFLLDVITNWFRKSKIFSFFKLPVCSVEDSG